MSPWDEPYKIVDCQFLDGSVSVEWQSHPDEGQPEGVVGTFASLGAALEAHPDAAPVCPGCEPGRPDERGQATHAEGCTARDLFSCHGEYEVPW